MTERKVSKVKVQECSVYKSCLTCLGAKSILWLVFPRKQVVYAPIVRKPRKSFVLDSLPQRTLCYYYTSNTKPITTNNCKTLDLVIENPPTLNLCAFTALDRTYNKCYSKPYGVNCTTPRTLPPIPAAHHFTAKLSVRTTQGPDFVASNFTFLIVTCTARARGASVPRFLVCLFNSEMILFPPIIQV
ncbi:unnamed protein product [Pieris macdunnoughi]|uniref:Uncharacterized protein n=1 Tax=Pieris macdunnoughi TaxID=345717 RepID=A0A821QVF7_9NEOP|nr:unnamed protein product [Pieris macdunnoughi]